MTVAGQNWWLAWREKRERLKKGPPVVSEGGYEIHSSKLCQAKMGPELWRVIEHFPLGRMVPC